MSQLRALMQPDEPDDEASSEENRTVALVRQFLDLRVLLSCLIAVTAPTVWLSSAYWQATNQVAQNRTEINEMKHRSETEAERTRVLERNYERILGKLETIEARINSTGFGGTNRN